MKENDFKKEILEYVSNAYDEYCSDRTITREIFRRFHEICINNGIQYYVAFGTALGVIRDGDIIPWDSDMDVMLPISSVEKLIEAFNRENDEDLYIDGDTISSDFPFYMIRIGNKKYDIDVFHLDVFYMCPTKVNSDYDKLRKKIRFIEKARRAKKCKKSNAISRLGRIADNILMTRYRLIPMGIINAMYKNVANAKLTDFDKYILIGESMFGKGAPIIDKAVLEPAEVVSLNGYEYCVPVQKQEYLRQFYGDNCGYYPIESRYKEFFGGYEAMKNCNKNIKPGR